MVLVTSSISSFEDMQQAINAHYFKSGAGESQDIYSIHIAEMDIDVAFFPVWSEH